MTWRSRAAQAGALAVLAITGGCSLGGDDDESPRPVRGASKQAAELVASLDRAVRARDWRRICDELFTRRARERAGGRDCPRLVRSSAGGLRGTSVELRELTLRSRRIEAVVRSRARGQPPLTDTLDIVRERGRYRIDSLR